MGVPTSETMHIFTFKPCPHIGEFSIMRYFDREKFFKPKTILIFFG